MGFVTRYWCLHRDEDRHAHHPSDLRRVDPARVHDDVGADGPLGGLDLVDAPSRTPMRRTRCARILAPRWRAPWASAIARLLGSRCPSVGRYTARRRRAPSPGRAAAPRPVPPPRAGARTSWPILLAPMLQEAVGRAREPEAAVSFQPGSRPVSAASIQPASTLHIARRVSATEVELADQACGVEGRAAGELGTCPPARCRAALGRQVVRDAHAAHAAPDDHCSRRARSRRQIVTRGGACARLRPSQPPCEVEAIDPRHSITVRTRACDEARRPPSRAHRRSPGDTSSSARARRPRSAPCPAGRRVRPARARSSPDCPSGCSRSIRRITTPSRRPRCSVTSTTPSSR